MAVDGDAEEVGKYRTASYDGGVWTYTRGWLVKTTDKTDREDTVSGANGLPAYGETHPGPIADAAYCTKIKYTPYVAKSDKAWLVVATYSSARTRSSSNAAQDEVLVSFSSELYQEPVFRDVTGKGVMNSAGDYFIDPSPTRDASHLVAKIRANVTSVPAWVITYINAVNSSQIKIGGLNIAKGVAKVNRIDVGERQNRGGSLFYPLDIEVNLRESGWRFQPLDAGFRERNSNDELVTILSDDDTLPTMPVLLNGSGKKLANPTPESAFFRNFQLYLERDLTQLPGIS